MALDEAPRFLAAHRLLLKLASGESASADGNKPDETDASQAITPSNQSANKDVERANP
jgi:hypothetical protein